MGLLPFSSPRPRVAATGLVAALVAGALAVPAWAAGSHRARPDLTVTSGTVTVASGRLSGSFKVKNVGKAKADASSAKLTATLGTKKTTLGSFDVDKLKAGRSTTVEVSGKPPSKLAKGAYTLTACADSNTDVTEATESNNCLAVGTWFNGVTPTPTPTPTPLHGPKVDVPTPTPAVTATPTPSPTPISTVPTAPIASYPRDQVFPVGSSFASVSSTYDGSNKTPTTLLIWLHGCGGTSDGDLYTVTPGGSAQNWIAASPGSVDGSCWDVDNDPAKVLATIADIETHFNIDRRRVIIGGYSSGGDLAYRTAFYNAGLFAGLLAENTSPFRDTGSTQAQSLAAASRKFNIVHLAHNQDSTYPLGQVRGEIQAVKDAGFPTQLIEVDGAHGDANTDPDVVQYLLPHMADGWLAPAS